MSHSPPPLSGTSPPRFFQKSGVPHPFHSFLNNPGSLFEHKFFTSLSVLMRNISEQIQDYTYYSVQGDSVYNVSSVRLDNHETEDRVLRSRDVFSSADEWVEAVLRGVLTFFCLLTATYFLNRAVLRRSVAGKYVQYGIELIVCHSIILPVLPFVALFFGTIGLLRLLIWVHIKLFYSGRRFLVSPEDGFWAYEEHGSSSSSIAIYMVEGVCDLEKIRDKVRNVIISPVVGGRMHRRMITVFGFAVWEKVEVNSDDHVRVAEWGVKDKRHGRKEPWSDKDVLEFLGTFQDTPIDAKAPAWETIIVPDVRIGGGSARHYACIFRMHHAIMDGISSANVLHQVLGDKPFKFTIDPVESGKRKPRIVTWFMFFMALLALPRTGLMSGLMHLDNKYNWMFSPGETLRGPKHFAWSRPFKMDAFKKLKSLTKSSVMTLLLSSLGGSYRKMEEGRRWRIGKGAKRLPEFYHALAPVALLPYPDRHPRNGFSGVVLPVCVGEHTSPVERLKVNDKEFKNLGIGIMDILGNFLLICMVGVMPNFLQKVFGGGVHAKMSLSNIPGSDEEITIFGGDRITEMGAWLPCKFTLGMAMGLFSYGGRCRATMVGDSTYLSKSDVESLVSNFETEICALGKCLGIPEDEIFY